MELQLLQIFVNAMRVGLTESVMCQYACQIADLKGIVFTHKFVNVTKAGTQVT